jgi:ATP-dependent Lhr-like helicase
MKAARPTFSSKSRVRAETLLQTSDTSSTGQYSASFERLDTRIQQWIWRSGWAELRDAQERAIPYILDGRRDVIIAAATAAGKTEAAFLPILTRLLESDPIDGVALYVSPLKALINDQWGRLDQLCEELEVSVVPWHGDVVQSRKSRFLKNPAGCILITPESLEAMFYNKGSLVKVLFANLRYVVVDELHSFMGSERGKQMQSLLTRLEVALKRSIPRIGLSATLGDIQLAAEFLRPGDAQDVAIVSSEEKSGGTKVLVKGYLDLPPPLTDAQVAEKQEAGEEVGFEDTTGVGVVSIARHLYQNLRGTNNLIFPNSRQQVERYTSLLRSLSEEAGTPPEFWPHHGNLSKEMREETEKALKQTERPASAVATSTLELGIDIGMVASVAQIGPAPAVSSLRQRLGRSGRRAGTPAILRGYVLEPPLDVKSPLADTLREGMVQLIAQIELLKEKWFEPPRAEGMHLSTLIQQTLSIIGQYGAVTAAQAYALLCKTGPFRAVTEQDYLVLLRALIKQDILQKDSDGALLHGKAGEAIANHYTFYAAFSSPDEYRLVNHGRVLGALPITFPVSVGEYLLFGGRRWKVELVDISQKVVEVTQARAGRAPAFGGTAGIVHTRVRQKMRDVLATETTFGYLDPGAQDLLRGARQAFRSAGLQNHQRFQGADGLKLFLWQGDEIQNTLALLFKSQGLNAKNEGLCVALETSDSEQLDDTVRLLLKKEPLIAEELLQEAETLAVEKWDTLVPTPLRERNYASLFLDIPAAYAFLREGLQR